MSRKKGFLGGEFKLPKPSEGGRTQRTAARAMSVLKYDVVVGRLRAGPTWDLE